jgi:phosphoglycolate phosphatase-like HAD superfamily hydrolase
MGIIFDLDQTLIHSLPALELRRQRRWSEVYPLIPMLQPFEGINEILNVLNNHNIPICIVTSSPRSYCDRIIKHWGWNNVYTVCYHDTKNHKPHPDPILKGVQLMGLNPNEVISIGDEAKDIIASKSAGVISIGALWGCTERNELLTQRPHYTFNNPNELLSFITMNLMKNRQ